MSREAIWIHLDNGPGEGRVFSAQRAPRYLRAVCDQNHLWDILELPDDAPEKDEEVFVYKQYEFERMRGGAKAGDHYHYRNIQIDGTLKGGLRYPTRWQSWARMEAQKALEAA
jgi:hypothetical protein